MSTCDRNEDCRNGGQCKFDAEQGVSQCQCADRYIGLKCTRYCPLQCENDGICRFRAGNGEDEHLYGIDTNIEHYECKCLTGFTGRRCEASYVECPDGNQCLNGGECTETSQNSTSYKCVCPYGFEGKQCAGQKETRTYQKGPVTKEPVSDGGIVAIVLVSLGIVIAVGFFVRMRRKGHKETVRASDHLDELVMMGQYSDNVSDEEDGDDETGLEATTIT